MVNVGCFVCHNIAGASKQNRVLLNNWGRWGFVLKRKNNLHTAQPVQSKFLEAVRSQIDLKRPYLHSVWSSLCSHSEDFSQFLWMTSFQNQFQDFLKQLPVCFSCSGECCNTLLLWSFRNVQWTRKLHPNFHFRVVRPFKTPHTGVNVLLLLGTALSCVWKHTVSSEYFWQQDGVSGNDPRQTTVDYSLVQWSQRLHLKRKWHNGPQSTRGQFTLWMIVVAQEVIFCWILWYLYFNCLINACNKNSHTCVNNVKISDQVAQFLVMKEHVNLCSGCGSLRCY